MDIKRLVWITVGLTAAAVGILLISISPIQSIAGTIGNTFSMWAEHAANRAIVASDNITPGELTGGVLPTDVSPLVGTRGIIVCEPVPAPALAGATAAFTDGCGEWLDFAMSNQWELSATPMPEVRDNAVQELKRHDLRIGIDKAAQLYSIGGANIVAVGQANGSPSAISLTYTLYSLPNRTQIGDSVTVSGSEGDIVAALPTVASKLCGELRITPAADAREVNLAPDQLALCGRLRWIYSGISKSDLAALATAAQRSHFAGVLAVDRLTFSKSPHEYSDFIDKYLLDTEYPEPVVLAVANNPKDAALTHYEQLVRKLLVAAPYNFQGLVAQVMLDRELNSGKELADAKLAVSSAPQNPQAWDVLALTYSNVYNQLRGGRSTDQIGPTDGPKLETMGQNWIGCAEEAVKLDPLCGHAWSRLSEATPWMGLDHETFGAIRKTIELGKPEERDSAYAWGMNLCQDKWFFNPLRKNEYVHEVCTNPALTPGDINSVASDLIDVDYIEPVATISQAAIDRAAQLIATNPKLPDPYAWTGYAYFDMERYRTGATWYKKAVALDPTEPAYHFYLARMYKAAEDPIRAIPEFQTALRLSPNYPDAHAYLGIAYLMAHQYDDAERTLKQALVEDPQELEAVHGLEDVYILQKKYTEGASICRDEVSRQSMDMFSWINWICCLDYAGEYSQAISAGQKAMPYCSDSARFLAGFADVYTKDHQPDHAISLCQQALQIEPDNELAYENIAEADYVKGDKTAAMRQWQDVVRSHSDQSAVAAAFLKKYHMPLS